MLEEEAYIEFLWHAGWLTHGDWVSTRVASSTCSMLLKDAPSHGVCKNCAVVAMKFRRMEGTAGPAAEWLCWHCLPAKTATHLSSILWRPWACPDTLRTYLQGLLRSYRPIKFIQAGHFNCRQRRILTFEIALVSVPGHRTVPPRATFSMSSCIQAPDGLPPRSHKHGYFNCVLDFGPQAGTLIKSTIRMASGELTTTVGCSPSQRRLSVQRTSVGWLYPVLPQAIAARMDGV